MLKYFEPYIRQLILLLSQFLTFEYAQPQIIQLVLIIVIQLQPLSFSYYNIYNTHKLFEFSFESLITITRPYLYFTNTLTVKIILGIAFSIQQLILICTCYVVIKNKNKQNDTKSIGWLIKFICNFFYLFSTLFYSWIMELCLMNINTIYGIILSGIAFLEIIFIVITSDLIYQGVLVLRVSTQLPLNLNTINCIIKPLRIIQIFVFYFMTNYMQSLNIQNILTLIIQFLYIYQMLELNLYAKQKCVFASLSISSISIILSIEAIATQQQPQGNLWLLLSGLFIYLFLQLYQNKNIGLSSNERHKLKYLFSIVETLDGNQQEDRLQMNLMLFQHKQICQRCDCICKYPKNIKQQLLQIIEMKLESHLEQRTNNFEKAVLDLSQILFRKRQFVKAQQVIYKILYSKDNYQINNYTVGLTSECLFNFLKQQIDSEVLIQMMEKMILTNPNSKLIADSLKQFANNESSDQYIQQQLRKMIVDKIQFYYTFIEHANKYQGSVDYSLKVIQDLQAFRLELKERYEKFPTLSNQNILKFYLLEVLNDYIEAYNIHKNKAFDDEKYSIFHDSIYTKLLGQNPTYVAAEINKDLDVLIIRQSKKAAQRFQKIYGSRWKSQGEINLNECLPEYVQKVHRTLIQSFLDEGINKYYQQQNLSFFKIYDRVMMPVEMMVGLNQSSEQTFSFLIFFYEQLDYRSYIVVNSNSDIINCSDNISSQVLTSTSMGLISCKSFGIIHNIIPEFDEMIRSKNRFFFNQIIKLANKQNAKMNEYITNITIDKKFKNEEECFMITMDNLRTNNPRCLSESRLETSIYQKQATFDKWINLKKMNEEIEENIDKALPYQEVYDKSYLKNNYVANDQTQPFESKFYVAELLPEKEINNMERAKKIFSPKDSMNEQFILHKDDLFRNEVRDYVSGSSVTAIKRSKFYKKFEIIYYLCKSGKRSTKILKISANYILLFLIILIYVSIVLFQLLSQHLTFIQNIFGFISDIQLLAVRFDVTEPLESFTVSRYTLINYKEMQARKVINATYSAQLQKFPLSCLQDAFSKMKEGMTNVLSRHEIDQLQNVTYIPVMMYEGPNYTAAEYNVTQRSLIIITLNYQYDFRINLQNGGGGFDTPFFYFTYKDYQIIKSTLDNLNVIILEITIDRSVQETIKWLYGLVPFMCTNFLITVFIVIQYIKHNNEKNQIMKYIQSFDIEVIESEKQRLQYLSSLVYSDLESIKAFTFDVDQVDCTLQKSNLKQKQNYQKKNHGKLINSNPYSGIMCSVFHFAIFCTFSIYLYLTFIIYFEKYQKTAIFYQQLSDLGVDIPAIYAQKEILFRLKNRYPFLNSTDINETYDVLQRSIDSVQIYQQKNLQLNSNDYLFDKNLVDFFMSINSGNLCEYQSEELNSKTQSFCPQIMKGNLLQGFQQTLIYIINSAYTQQQETKNFTVQPSSTLLELEGSTILTDIIKTMKEKFYENLVLSAQTLIQNCSIITSVYLVFEGIFALIYYYNIDAKTTTQFSTLKKSVYLFPRFTLLFDDSFYRNFITIIREEEFLE